MNFRHLNSECFQIFLNLLSAHFQGDIVIMQVDQAGAHRAKCLKIPKNIILLFQPAMHLRLIPLKEYGSISN